MGLLHMVKNLHGAEGVREAMRMSYDKHLKKAQAGTIRAPDTTPAHCALYGALATRYRAGGRFQPEAMVWAELAPFLALRDSDGREFLAEYVVYCERNGEARVDALRAKVNEGLRSATAEIRMMGYMAFQSGVAWVRLLHDDVRSLFESFLDDAE